MNDDVIADLKQFISTTVSQQGQQLEDRLTARIDAVDEKLSTRIDSVEEKLTQRIDDLTAFVTEALDTANETAGEQLRNHERRITKLEQATA